MDRRSFLRGTFGGVAAGGIVIAAANTDIEAFASTLQQGQIVGAVASNPEQDAAPEAGEIVFNHRGEPLGIIREWHISTEQHPMSGYGSTWEVHTRGISTMTIIATGLCGVKFNPTLISAEAHSCTK